MLLFDRNVEAGHDGQPWCDEIMRITPQLDLALIKARRIDGKVTRRPSMGLSRISIARWPDLMRPASYYRSEGRVGVPI